MNNAVSYLKKFTEPFDAEMVGAMGVQSWMEKDYDSAIKAYLHAIKLDPQPPMYVNLAVCYDDAGNVNEAVKTLEEFYELVSSPLEVRVTEKLLKDNGKNHLIKKTDKQKIWKLQNRGFLRLGSRSSTWIREFISKPINQNKIQTINQNNKKKDWYDFSVPSEVIFGYPPVPGVFARIIGTVKGYVGSLGAASENPVVFIFVYTENGIVIDISYSVMDVSPDGEGTDLLVSLHKEDASIVKGLLCELTS